MTLVPSFPSPSSSPSSLATNIIWSFIRTSPRQVGHAPGRAVLGQGQHVKCSQTTRMAWMEEERGWNKPTGDCCLSCADFGAWALDNYEFLLMVWTGGSDDGSKGEICALNSLLQQAISMDYTCCCNLYWGCNTAPNHSDGPTLISSSCTFITWVRKIKSNPNTGDIEILHPGLANFGKGSPGEIFTEFISATLFNDSDLVIGANQSSESHYHCVWAGWNLTMRHLDTELWMCFQYPERDGGRLLSFARQMKESL